jgi:1-acyl-sn-glycerol-3-phosphate acyltransferase
MNIHKLCHILYQPYKWLFLIPFICVNTLFFATIAVLLSIVVNPKIGSIIGVIWAKVNSFFTPIIVNVIGKENIKKNTSYIIVTNHQSYYDIFLIYGWIGIDIKWVMKKELRKVPGLGVACEKIGHIFLDRSNKKDALKTLNKAKSKLINGTSIVIFPEGTRSKSEQLNPFKRGAFKLAYDLNLPILPITLIGTGKVLPTDTLNIFPGKTKMIIHQPIDINKYKEENIKLLMDDVKEIIAGSL